MRISSLKVTNIPPVKLFDVSGLSDFVVIAGPNGVGKTRLIEGLINGFRNFQATVQMSVEATNETELTAFGKRVVNTEDGEANKIRSILQTNKFRRNFTSSVLYFESGRSIQNVAKLNFAFEFPDPYKESVNWDFSLQGLANRWPDTQTAIFKKIQNQRTALATRAIQLKSEGKASMNLEFEDPLGIFKEAFERLLGPKTLSKADLNSQTLFYKEDGEERPIDSLSSGGQLYTLLSRDSSLGVRETGRC